MKAWEIFHSWALRQEFWGRNRLEKTKLRGDVKIIIAVSGGADSMCLAHLFWRLAKKENISLLIVHFDHGLRKEGAAEAEMVKDFAQKLGAYFIFQKLLVKQYAKENFVSIETAGRELRYKALEKIAIENKVSLIATAHNANDNAETVLMKIIRGSASASGIPQVRSMGKVKIIRPILGVKRSLIESYVGKHKIVFSQDKSNFSDEFTRNKIRLNVLPMIEKINPSAVEHLCALSEIQMRQEAYFDEISLKAAAKIVRIGKDIISIELERLLRQDPIIASRIIKTIIPQKKNAALINLIMQKISSLDFSPHRLSSLWVFQIKSKKRAFFRRIK
jgi:tRNA(Ile)-lysidine synthase